MEVYFYILIIIGFLSIAYLLLQETQNLVPPITVVFSYLLCVFAIFTMANAPILIYDDKYMYQLSFNNITTVDIFKEKDIGFALYTLFCKKILGTSQLYFLVTAAIYTLSVRTFANKFVGSKYEYYLVFAFLISFGFFSYGTNTIRAGLALSLLLVALSNYKRKLLFIILSILALSCHKSIALPLMGFLLTSVNNNSRYYIIIWVFAFILSAINFTPVINFIQANLSSFDDRSLGYLQDGAKLQYKTGFRIDFIIYSLIPILIGYYYIAKAKVKDVFYIRIFNTYLFANAIWVLVIRMPFTDRIAYLSWVLIPVILLYPVLKYKIFVKQVYFIGVILLGIIGFTALMQFK